MADTAFVFKGIKPAKLQIEAIVSELVKEAEKEGEDQQKLLEKTVATWQGDKPKFESLTDVDSQGVTVITGPTGNTKAVQKWGWLNSGTKVRWAVMSGDWRSKTKPGSFQSGRGRGRVVIAGKRAMRRRGIAPRKGIEARDWTGKLEKQRKVPYRKRMLKASKRAARKAFK